METPESVKEYFEANKSKAPFVGKSLAKVDKLSGGLANYVHRLWFEDGSTVILKYFPRFLAFDKSVEMSQNRYFVEKMSLTLLEDQPWLKINPKSVIRTAKVLLADDENFTLIMEDAGVNTKPLMEHLKNNEFLISDRDRLVALAKGVHELSDYLTNRSNITFETHGKELENTRASLLIDDYVGHFCHERAKSLNLETELADYMTYISKAFRPFLDEQAAKEIGLRKVFVFGDFWPNSILVDSDRNLLWVVDWEMARFDIPTRDLEQFIANLWVMRQNKELFSESSIDTIIKQLQIEFFGDEKKDWRTCWKYSKETFVLWVTTLIKEKHWCIEDQRTAVLNAIKEVQNI